MSLENLARTFVLVVERGTVSAAAAALGLSVPAASRQLSRLEEEVGAKLLLRTPQGVRPTASGARFLPHARALVSAAARARELFRDEELSGTLVVSCSISWGLAVLVPRLARLQQLAPNLSIDLRLEDRVVDLVAEGADVAIRGGVELPDSTRYVAYPLQTVRRVVVASPALLPDALDEPEALEGFPCLVSSSGGAGPVTWTLQREGDVRVVEVDGPLRTRTLLAQREGALEGLGVALLPDFLCRAGLEARRLVNVLEGWEAAGGRRLSALTRIELRDDPKVRKLVQFLREEVPR